MVEINSNDYHDYVIKNGQLIGEFDQMYKRSKDVPWHQDQQEDWLDVRLVIQILKEYSPFDFICDLGCGLGYFLKTIAKFCGKSSCTMVGYDISDTACRKGKALFPDIQFRQFDIMSQSVGFSLTREDKKEKNRLFLFRGILWYVFPRVDNVVRNISNIVKKNDYFLVSQNFPPLHTDFVGKDIIPNPQTILDLFNESFNPLNTVWIEDKGSKGNENWFIAAMLRR